MHMQPDPIIDQFKATIELVLRKRFLSDEERYHQIVGVYEMAQAVLRLQPGVYPEETELPEHSVNAHLSELEQLFRDFCVSLNVPPQS